jgi:hypothetical protein
MTGGSRQRTAPYRSVRPQLGVGCLLVVSASLMACSPSEGHRSPIPELSPLAVELAELRADNNLFARPPAAEDRRASLFDSGYLLPLIAGEVRPAENPDALESAYHEACEHDALWATWAVSRLPSPLRGQVAIEPVCTDRALAQATQRGQGAEADISQLAAIAEALVVLDPEMLDPARPGMVSRITNALAEDAPPYLQVRARQGLRALGAAEAPPMPRLPMPEVLERTEDVMDLWAVLTTGGDDMHDRARGLLAPLLQQVATEGREFDLAYAVRAWGLAEGDPTVLEDLLAAIEGRIDPTTGLIETAVVLSGTLDSTYEVARLIPADQFAWIAGEGTAEAVHALVAPMIESKDTLGLLKAAYVLQQLGRTPDSTAASTAGRRTLEDRLGDGPIPVTQIGLLLSADRMFDLLAQDRLEIGIQTFETTDDETLHLFYSLVPYADSISDGQGLWEDHREDLARIPAILESPGDHPVQLLVSALRAAPFAGPNAMSNVDVALGHLRHSEAATVTPSCSALSSQRPTACCSSPPTRFN